MLTCYVPSSLFYSFFFLPDIASNILNFSKRERSELHDLTHLALELITRAFSFEMSRENHLQCVTSSILTVIPRKRLVNASDLRFKSEWPV
jgi:hypothetical protein